MNELSYKIHQLADEIQPPDTGKKSLVLVDDPKTKVIVFAFAAGEGLAEHIAPLPAIIQIIKGEGTLTFVDETVVAKPGTWIHMTAKTPHSVKATTPLVLLLTLLKRT